MVTKISAQKRLESSGAIEAHFERMFGVDPEHTRAIYNAAIDDVCDGIRDVWAKQNPQYAAGLTALADELETNWVLITTMKLGANND